MIQHESEFYLVLTDRVLNRDKTGYRGTYRTDPVSVAFSNNDLSLAQSLLEECVTDESYFASLEDAIKLVRCARKAGIECGIFRCVDWHNGLVEPHSFGGWSFLGYDVAQPHRGGYSAIVDRCLNCWRPYGGKKSVGNEIDSYETLQCIAEFFNAKLNEYRLFPRLCDAQRFLQVDRECAERFDGETNVDLGVVLVFEEQG